MNISLGTGLASAEDKEENTYTGNNFRKYFSIEGTTEAKTKHDAFMYGVLMGHIIGAECYVKKIIGKNKKLYLLLAALFILSL